MKFKVIEVKVQSTVLEAWIENYVKSKKNLFYMLITLEIIIVRNI